MAQVSVSRTDDGFLVRIREGADVAELPLSFAEAAPLGSLLVESRIPNENVPARLLETPFLCADEPLYDVSKSDQGKISLAILPREMRPLIVQMDRDYCLQLCRELAVAAGLTE